MIHDEIKPLLSLNFWRIQKTTQGLQKFAIKTNF